MFDNSYFSIEILVILALIILFDITSHILSHIFFKRINLKTNFIYHMELLLKLDEISARIKKYPVTKHLLYLIIIIPIINIIGLIYILTQLFK